MNDDQPRRLERSAFGALVAFLLAPIVAHGLWLPLVHVFGPAGTAGAVTWAALAITAAVFVVQQLRVRLAALVSFALGGLVAIGASLSGSLGAAGLLTLLGVAAAMALLLWWLSPRLPRSLDGLARRHVLLCAVYLALSAGAVVTTARLSVFIGDPTRVDQQVLPDIDFISTHSCLTAYVHAAELSRQGVDNLYAEQWWHGSHGFPPPPEGAENPYRPFVLDYYAYPPPFLLIMAPLAPLEGDFAAQRALWFGLNGLLLAAGLWVVSRWLDGPNAHRVLLLSPLFLGSMPVLVTLQIGNFQVAVVVLSVLAMVAFHRDRPATGGALLAFTILSKISPGVLAIVPLAQRRLRPVAWIAGFGALFLGLSVLMFGAHPLYSFLTYALPRVSSGAAFAFMDDTPFNILTNLGPFGLPFKLQLVGLDVGDPWRLAPTFGHVYTAVLVVLAVVGARRPGDRRAQAMIWMSLLVLAALQSPFAPGYTTVGLLWAMVLLAVEVRRVRDGVALALGWVLLTFIPPISSLPLLGVYTLFQSALTMGVPMWLIVRAPRVALAEAPAVEATGT